MIDLRCYCCGAALGARIALVTMAPYPVDRVFTVEPEHLENFDDATQSVVYVREVAP